VIWWANGGWTLCALAALGGCLVAACGGGRSRRAWLLFAGAGATWLDDQFAWDDAQLVAPAPAPFPSLGDVGWLGFVPWFVAGLWARPSSRLTWPWWPSLVALALTLIGKVVALAYPVAYLTLGLGTFLLMLRVPGLVAARNMGLLLLGLLCEGAAFVAWTLSCVRLPLVAAVRNRGARGRPPLGRAQPDIYHDHPRFCPLTTNTGSTWLIRAVL